jgi:hypothetical protein
MAAAVLVPNVGAEVGPIGSTTKTVGYACKGVGFAALAGAVPNQDVTLTIGAPTTVTAGQDYVVTVDISPLSLAAPAVPIEAPAYLQMSPIGGTGSDSGRARSANVSFSGKVATVPRLSMTVTPTAAVGGSVTVTAGMIRIVQGSSGFECTPVAGATPATLSTAVVAGGTTPTSTSTTPTTTSTTIPVEQPPGTEVFSCDILGKDGTKYNSAPLVSPVTALLTLPAQVETGGTVNGTVRLDPGPMNGPIALPASSVVFAVELAVTGGSPATVEATGVPAADIPVNTPTETPAMPFSVTATAAVGSEVTFGVKKVELRVNLVVPDSPPLEVVTLCLPTGDGLDELGSVDVVSKATTTTTSTTPASTSSTAPATLPPPTTAPPSTSTTSTTQPDPAPPTPTTAPATPTTASGGQAVLVESSATESFTCNIYDSTGTQFNQNPIPPSTVKATIVLPDKVSVGGAISGSVRFDPGPMNGPIKLPAGTVNFAADLAVTGGSPATVRATGGPNAADIPANTASRIPDMPFQLTASAAAGSAVKVGITKVEVQASNPAELVTSCQPSGPAVAEMASVAVVAEAVAPPPVPPAAAGGAGGSGSGGTSGPSDGGYADCAAAKAAGRGTIVKTDPAYRARLDDDGDGLACEKNEGKAGSLAYTGSGSGRGVALSSVLLLLGALFVAVSRRSAQRRTPATADAG